MSNLPISLMLIMTHISLLKLKKEIKKNIHFPNVFPFYHNMIVTMSDTVIGVIGSK